MIDAGWPRRGERSTGRGAPVYLFDAPHNQHAEDFCRSVTTLRILKDRFTGQANGKILLLGYDSGNGKQYELSASEISLYNETKDSTNIGFVSEDF